MIIDLWLLFDFKCISLFANAAILSRQVPQTTSQINEYLYYSSVGFSFAKLWVQLSRNHQQI